jgi:signal transduction histidine kinase
MTLSDEDLDLGWLFECVREPLIVAAADSGRIVAANPAARSMFGDADRERLDGPLEALVEDRVRSSLRTQLLERAIEQGSARLELPTARTTDGVAQIELTATRLGGDAPSRVLVSIRDVSDQRQSHMRREALLRLARLAAHGDQEELLSALLTEAVTLLDADDGGIAQWDAAKQVLVQARSFLPSSNVGAVIPLQGSVSGRAVRLGAPDIENDYQRAVGALTPAGRLGATAVIAMPLLQEGRLLGTLSVSRFEPGKPFTQADADMLELLSSTVAATLIGLERSRELEAAVEQLQSAKDAAEAGERAKSAILANMSHELRTPLNAIIGYCDLLIEEAGEREPGSEVADLRRIRAAGDQLLRLVHAVLDLADIEAGRLELHPERFDVADLLQQVEAAGKPMVDKGHATLKVDCPADLGSMRADVAKLRQVLLALIGNAAELTERGTIRLGVVRDPKPEGDRFVFSVTNNGIGLPPQQQREIFEPFSQAEAATSRDGSAGLSLAMSRRFCQLMGGDIHVASNPGGGSTFTVSLPAQPPRTRTDAPHT